MGAENWYQYLQHWSFSNGQEVGQKSCVLFSSTGPFCE